MDQKGLFSSKFGVHDHYVAIMVFRCGLLHDLNLKFAYLSGCRKHIQIASNSVYKECKLLLRVLTIEIAALIQFQNPQTLIRRETMH